MNGCEFSPTLGMPSVHIDNAKAAYEAMDHLYGLGHRRIGIVTGPLVSPLSRDRLARRHGPRQGGKSRAPLHRRAGGFFNRVGRGRGRAAAGAREPPTAIFCFNDEMAMGVIEMARQRSVHVPRDLSVVGFDDIRSRGTRIRR